MPRYSSLSGASLIAALFVGLLTAPAAAQTPDELGPLPWKSPDPAKTEITTPALPAADHAWRAGTPGEALSRPEVPRSDDALVVGPGADFKTIGQAIAASQPGGLITVRAGRYTEAIQIAHDLTIVGEAGVEIVATGASTVQIISGTARIAHLKLRQIEDGRRYFGVEMKGGALIVQDCDITSRELSGVIVHPGARAWLEDNNIHHAAQAGVFVYDTARATLVGNNIHHNKKANLEVRGATITARDNTIHHGGGAGVFLYQDTIGVLSDNAVHDNAMSGFEITGTADPILRANLIRDNTAAGVLVTRGGRGLIEGNKITGHRRAGVEVRDGANPIARGNTISGGQQSGIFVLNTALGLFENNDITEHKLSGIEVLRSAATIRGNRISKNGGAGVFCREGCAARVTANVLVGNRQAWILADGSASKFIHAQNTVKGAAGNKEDP